MNTRAEDWRRIARYDTPQDPRKALLEAADAFEAAETERERHAAYGQSADQEIKRLQRQLATARDAMSIARTAIQGVLCDPEGRPCFVGKDQDRAEIQMVLDRFDALEHMERPKHGPLPGYGD